MPLLQPPGRKAIVPRPGARRVPLRVDEFHVREGLAVDCGSCRRVENGQSHVDIIDHVDGSGAGARTERDFGPPLVRNIRGIRKRLASLVAGVDRSLVADRRVVLDAIFVDDG